MTDNPVDLDNLLKQVADKPLPLARLALLLLAKGQEQRARQVCASALDLAPQDAEIRALAAEVLSHGVPSWFYSLVQDSARHKIYESAFRRAIRPGSLVLDIGSGTGLFAMMAARAGAGKVVTCEANPVVAAIATEVIRHNGLAEKISVVAKQSFDLDIESDVGGSVDVIVWDNLSRSLIGAGALATLEHAVRRLSHPATRVIPARGSIRVALAEYFEPDFQMRVVEGFDLSPFNRLAFPRYDISRDDKGLRVRSDAVDLFTFDFEAGGPFPETKSKVSLTSHGGRVNGVAQWIRLDLDDAVHYENAPPVHRGASLGIIFYPFMRPIETKVGDHIAICGFHDRNNLRIWGA